MAEFVVRESASPRKSAGRPFRSSAWNLEPPQSIYCSIVLNEALALSAAKRSRRKAVEPFGKLRAPSIGLRAGDLNGWNGPVPVMNGAQRLNGLNCLNVWNGYFLGNREPRCQKIFFGVS
jgi:hypothetical protein